MEILLQLFLLPDIVSLLNTCLIHFWIHPDLQEQVFNHDVPLLPFCTPNILQVTIFYSFLHLSTLVQLMPLLFLCMPILCSIMLSFHFNLHACLRLPLIFIFSWTMIVNALSCTLNASKMLLSLFSFNILLSVPVYIDKNLMSFMISCHFWSSF